MNKCHLVNLLKNYCALSASFRNSTIFKCLFRYYWFKSALNKDLSNALYFLNIALGVGHIKYLLYPLPSPCFSYFHISIYFIFSICYSGPAERGKKEHFRICKILLPY